MPTFVYDRDNKHTSTALGTCESCGGTLWQSGGEPKRCDPCQGISGSGPDAPDVEAKVTYKHDEGTGKVEARPVAEPPKPRKLTAKE